MPEQPHLSFPVLIATAGGLGMLRPAPGTWGSLGAALAAWPVLLLPVIWWAPIYLAAALVATVAGLLSCPAAARYFGCEDPGQVVIDEVAGVWVACAILPLTVAAGPAWPWLVAVFLGFRFFDILKPWPIRRLERIGGSWGVMMDDLLAGAFAACACYLLKVLIL